MDFDERKLLAHLKTADRNGARYALILGDDELAAEDHGSSGSRGAQATGASRWAAEKTLRPPLCEMGV